MDDEITPGRLMRSTFTWAGPLTVTAIVAVLCGALVLLVGWQVGGWFQQASLNRTNHLIQGGYANQTALVQHIGQQFTDLATLQRDERVTPANRPFDRPEILREAGQVCGEIPQLTIGYDPSWRTWAQANCANGALSITSRIGN